MKILFLTRYVLAFALLGYTLSATGPLDAAARKGEQVPGRKTFSPGNLFADPLIRRMQAALKKTGYYKGPISGSINNETDAAIRTYQRRENIPVDGIVTKRLVDHLESSTKVQSLLQQLQSQRLLKIKAAREALMQSPETRRLLAGDKERDEVADATRDPAPCFAAPTPRCLLEEASHSARAIYKDELRFWALSEILVSEAKAGLVEKAMMTVRRIDDPRLMIVALRDIAEAQARSGRPTEALTAAGIIPETSKRAEALAAIATIQAESSTAKGGDTGTRRTLELLFQTLAAIDDPIKRITLQSQGAVTLYKSGDAAAARETITKAHTNAREINDRKARSVALRHVASALADIGRPQQALEILKSLPETSEHTPVLVSAAAAQALAGRADLALATASSIETVRYRAVVLGRIALAQATAGHLTAANQTLEKALDAIKLIKLPFAQAYAHEQMAQTLKSIARLQTGKSAEANYARAVVSAGRISDNTLRARTLWAIAEAERASGNATAAGKTESLAETATASIRSKLSMVWMFCNIATDLNAAAAPQPAQKAFDRALGISEGIDNPWSRARALARLASTQVDLSAGD